MKCLYHPETDSREFCGTCSKALCADCSHQIKGKVFCQDCLVRGAEWAATVKDLRIPSDSPKRAALLSLIPGIGAVYNGEYEKAITQFAVFAALCIMGDFHGVFGFGASVFLIFTMFDSHRTAEAKLRLRLQEGAAAGNSAGDRAVAVWGILLICLGMLFLLKNFIRFDFVSHLWPVVFIGLGAYLVYKSLHDRNQEPPAGNRVPFGENKS
jgi:hypothetical protein